MKITKQDFGRVCTVKFDDGGQLDGILVGSNTPDSTYSVYLFNDRDMQRVDRDQFVTLGRHVNYIDVAGKFSRKITKK